MGEVLERQGEISRARAIYGECLLLSRELGSKPRCAFLLRHFGSLAQSQRQAEHAVRLYAAAAHWDTASGLFTTLVDPLEQEQVIAALRAQLGEGVFAACWAEGQAMTLDQAVDYALALPEWSVSEPLPVAEEPAAPLQPALPAGLSAREVDVLRLLVQGLTNAQIAGQLVISPRTVNHHLTSIYTKLDVTSRHAATRFALDHHLV
jgi:DNA-binding CsgD family transcriptional regulator